MIEEPVMMGSEQAPPSLAEEREAPVFGEEVMVEEAAAEESMEAEALPMMMSEEPALQSETAEAEPPALEVPLEFGFQGRTEGRVFQARRDDVRVAVVSRFAVMRRRRRGLHLEQPL